MGRSEKCPLKKSWADSWLGVVEQMLHAPVLRQAFGAVTKPDPFPLTQKVSVFEILERSGINAIACRSFCFAFSAYSISEYASAKRARASANDSSISIARPNALLA